MEGPRLEALESNLQKGAGTGRKLVIKTLESIHMVNTDQMVYCESDGPYTTISMEDGRTIVSSRPIGEYDEMLSEYGFYRVHRSFLINLAHILRFDKQEGGSVVLTGDAQIPVARRKREELLELFERLT